MFIQSIDTRSLALPAWTQFEEPMSVTRLFGLPVANTTTELALDWLQHRLDTGIRTRVAFLNAHCVNQAARDPMYRTSLDEADLVLPDTTYLERHDAMSLLDRPISDPDGAAGPIDRDAPGRQPSRSTTVAQPDPSGQGPDGPTGRWAYV